MILKEYQKKAIKELLSATIKTINKGGPRNSLVFKSPTGSGKTVVMQYFLKYLSETELNEEYCFLWISVNDLSRQSKASFEKNLEGTKLRFSELSDITDKEIKDNEILFINWESINKVDRATKEWKVLAMKDNERDENLPTYLNNVHKLGRKVILIVDESHRSLDTPKAQELIQQYIKPTLQIEVSATPDSSDYNEKVEVNIDDVIEEGMIKKEILINENLKDIATQESETDTIILSLAFKKQKELMNTYEKEKSKIKPLVLIQLPSEAKKTSTIDKSKLDRVIHILETEYDITFNNQKLAIWLSEDKTNKELVDIENSPVEVLIFKQAIATGWDCPRAQILVMFREIKTITFEIQTVGRILRMPEWKHYENEILNKAYVYTDLPKVEIGIGETAKNLIKSQIGIRNKELYKPFYLSSFYKSRGDYQDIGLSFYRILAETFVKKINGNLDESLKDNNLEKLERVIDIENKDITNTLISDGKILVDIDNHTGEKIIAESEVETKTQEELIKLTFDNFARNEVGPQFTNIARSYKAIIEGLYTSLDRYFFGTKTKRLFYQKLILNNTDYFIDLLKEAKDIYVPKRKTEVRAKRKHVEKKYTWTIPSSQGFTQKAKEKDYKKNVIFPSFVEFDSEGEMLFIEKFLETSSLVDFWYKNGVGSQEFFAVPYDDEYGKKRSFYPDFIVQFTNDIIGIFDTKSGFTLKDGRLKAKGLERYIEQNNQIGRKLIGGIVEVKKVENTDTITMQINSTWNYSLDHRGDFTLFGDTYVQNYSFNAVGGNFDTNRDKIHRDINLLNEELGKKERELSMLNEKQKEEEIFDVEKIFGLKEEMRSIENIIYEKELFLGKIS